MKKISLTIIVSLCLFTALYSAAEINSENITQARYAGTITIDVPSF